MATQTNMTPLLARASRNTDLLLALAVMSIIMVLVLPLVPMLLDLLLALSITLSILILFVALFTVHPLDFSAFPTVLLITTLFRLSLNVASTRLILGNGHTGLNAAGAVIRSFGDFVVAGNFVVGIIIFLILVLINFVVITKGAGRIAEVAARFTLDAMPGKQMAIDADLNAGIVDEKEAKRRRARIQQEADFYGAMDGASKFVRGDAIAGLVITAANIGGGLLIGMFQHDMTLQAAVSTFTVLTVGDGLVAQMPALIVSVAAGIAVTKASIEQALSEDLKKQLLGNPRPLGIAAAVVGGFAIIPGMPTFPLLVVSLVTGGLAYLIKQNRERIKGVESEQQAQQARKEAEEAPEDIEGLLPIDILGFEMGYGLIPLVDAEQDGELLERVKSIRRQIALDMGFVVPPIHIKDNLELPPGAYSIIIKGVEVARGEVMPDHLLAMKTGDVESEIAGIDTIEPAFGLPALWITKQDQEAAQFAGYTVVDVPTVLATHLTEIIRRQAPEFLGRQEAQRLVDNFAKTEPKVVEELIPAVLPLGVVQKVLQNLLRERVSVRDLHTILETMADMGTMTKDPDLLTEYVRQAMARAITRQYQTGDGTLPLVSLSQEYEDQLANAVQNTPQGTYLGLDPEMAQTIIHGIEAQLERFTVFNYQPILLCSPLIRPHVKRLTERFIPNLVVLSHNEIAHDVRLESLGVVG
ncbi:MAG: flagellar biosynthesis protein FlhA [Candidatus Lambdaproteobacteria bacterium]|nr:flagellar biosynthesis protein FlhA [Candidatus Lambdaproteobacteria bacterium]